MIYAPLCANRSRSQSSCSPKGKRQTELNNWLCSSKMENLQRFQARGDCQGSSLSADLPVGPSWGLDICMCCFFGLVQTELLHPRWPLTTPGRRRGERRPRVHTLYPEMIYFGCRENLKETNCFQSKKISLESSEKCP